MKSINVEELRALIRLIAPARALRDDLEKHIHLELFEGMGDLAVRSYHGLQQSAYALTDDPYVAALTLDLEGRDERQRLLQVMLATGQLLAYLEAQTGLPAKQSGSVFQTAPNVSINMDNFNGGDVDLGRIADVMGRLRPPVPPRPPKPPKPPFGWQDDED